jgi:hypothetical protein
MEHRNWYGKDILEECNRLRKVLQPISDTHHGPLDRNDSSNTLFPFVLLLGNHSSGKSSFINYILNRKVQQTGVAPTDDCFTIICPGEADMDKNGPAFVGDPDLGFSGLKSFGPVLVNHTQLKVRSNIAVKDFMIIDSPGMIDSPVSRNTADVVVGEDNEVLDRGYDFAGVCRWYAERADVILLFFDPDKPGTTGETLSILTKSLKGFDHKLHIILNKADQFRKIHDFARAYGSLCWNLSKVIARKDLPRIHTMCLPTHALPSKSPSPLPIHDDAGEIVKSPSPIQSVVSTTVADDLAVIQTEHLSSNDGDHVRGGQTVKILTRAGSTRASFFEQGFLDLEEARTEVIREAFNAPKRRVDNEISRLFEDVVALEMHCKVVQEIVSRYNHKLWSARLWSLGTALLSVGATIGIQYLCDYLAQRRIVWTASSVMPVLQSIVPSFIWPFASSSSLTSVKDAPAVSPEPPAATVVSAPATAATATTARGSGRGSTSGNAGRVSAATVRKGGPVTVAEVESPVDGSTESDTGVSVNPDHIYQRIILSTGLTGVVTTALITAWKYLDLYRHLQQYAPSFEHDTTKRRPRWSVFGFASFTQPTVESTLSGAAHPGDHVPSPLHHDVRTNRSVYESIVVDLHVREYKKDDKFTMALAGHVLDHLCDHLTPHVVPTLSGVSKKQFEALTRIMNDDIANLRRRATPSFPALSPPPKVLSLNTVSPTRAWTPSPSAVPAEASNVDHHTAVGSRSPSPLSPVVVSSTEDDVCVGNSDSPLSEE